MQNVVGYVRVSTPGQVKDGFSLQYQVDEITRYCRKNNWNLLRIYEDRGINGAKVDEEGLTVEREGLHSKKLPTERKDGAVMYQHQWNGLNQLISTTRTLNKKRISDSHYTYDINGLHNSKEVK